MVYNPLDRDGDGKVSKKERRKFEKTGGKIDKFQTNKYAEQFGYSANYLRKHPELVELFNEMIQEDVTSPELIAARLEGSEWYQRYNAQWLAQDKIAADMGDDAFDAFIDRDVEQLRKEFTKQGATPPSDDVLRDIALKAWYGQSETRDAYADYDDEWMQDTVNGYIDFDKTQTLPNGTVMYDFDGKAGSAADELYQLARNYGIDTSMSNEGFTNWFQQTLRLYLDEDIDQSELDQGLKDMARKLYPGLASQIDSGYNVRTAMDPYLTAVAEELELPEIEINDPLMQKIMGRVDDKGQFAPMNLWEAKLEARKDERFDYTSTATKEKTDIASRILKDFGFLG
jgi:hypothetical protein